MINRVLVIHNPVAGRRRKKRLDKLINLLDQEDFSLRVHETSHRGDAHQEAARATDVDAIIVAGGDGTVNEVVNGLYARDDVRSLPALGFLPLGTANVLAWELDLPRRPAGLVKLIRAGKTLEVRPGLANGHRFLLMASVGLDARAVAAVTAPLKRRFGALAYIIGAVQSLRTPAPTYKVMADGTLYEAKTVILTRARRYGGPFILSRDAGLDTAVLQVGLFSSSGFFTAMGYGIGLVLGRLSHNRNVKFFPASRVDITCDQVDPVQIDGDIVCDLPLQVSLENNPVRLLIP